MKARQGALFCGGSARMVEAALGIEGDDILYVGDHIYTDAALAKINFRWRTALIVSTHCMGTSAAQASQGAPGQYCSVFANIVNTVSGRTQRSLSREPCHR
jgi:hypothetical protein